MILAGSLFVVILGFALAPTDTGGLVGGLVGCERSADLADGPRTVVAWDHEIHVYAPKDGARVSRSELSDLVLRWSAVEGTRQYRLYVTDEVGDLVWQAGITDTTTTLPEKVARIVLPNTRLKWFIQAPRESAGSDLYRIEILP